MGVMGALRRNTRVKIKEKLSREVPHELSFKERVERGALGQGGGRGGREEGGRMGIQRTCLKAQG